jgi:DNA-binding transcriptional LysR family regulator
MHISVDTDDLRTLVAISRFGSLQEAAAALGINQRSLSRVIHRLERQLGVQLFVWRQKKLQPTQAGRLFTERAEALLGILRDAVEQMRAPESVLVRLDVSSDGGKSNEGQ